MWSDSAVVCALASRCDGLLINISKQSIIMVVLFPNECLKHCGIVRHKSSRSSQLISGASRTSSATIQAEKILETVERETLKRYERS